jgi:hypothetical protein
MATAEGFEPPFTTPVTIREVEALLGYAANNFLIDSNHIIYKIYVVNKFILRL